MMLDAGPYFFKVIAQAMGEQVTCRGLTDLVGRYAAVVLVLLLSISLTGCDRTPAIHAAVRDDDLERIKALLKADPELISKRDNITDNGEGPWAPGGTPLHAAAFYGHKDAAELLLANKAEINAQDIGEQTPLLIAVGEGHLDVAELLIASNADINIASNDGETPLYLASGADLTARAGYERVVALLLAKGANINARAHGETPLKYALRLGETNNAEMLRQHGGHE